ncbi:hypothetical protein EYC84_008762 [Monilinia fructicola]|uniref:Uncharacterized protein n=1 Tax=Monilinia fructicola TaxID=38448 RepID=A0A5M9JC29_MONFR|nr:hypothetical protein EYC84_008762 [Monilinia fructicola]
MHVIVLYSRKWITAIQQESLAPHRRDKEEFDLFATNQNPRKPQDGTTIDQLVDLEFVWHEQGLDSGTSCGALADFPAALLAQTMTSQWSAATNGKYHMGCRKVYDTVCIRNSSFVDTGDRERFGISLVTVCTEDAREDTVLKP